MIRLHYSPGNASLIPHLLLEELGVPYELVLVDRANQAHKSPEYLKLNPNGLIPVLEDDDLVLYETAAICLHLLDRYPQSGLAPKAGTTARAHFYKWLVWMTNSLQTALIVYFYPERWADDASAVGEVQAHAEAKVGVLLAQLDVQLAGAPWLLGEAFSALDLYALVMCRWTRGFASRPARDYPQLGPYLRRLLARPAVQRVFEREGLTPPLV